MKTSEIKIDLPLQVAVELQAAADRQGIPVAVLVAWLIEDEISRQKRRNAWG